jgi:hypothetical protein
MPYNDDFLFSWQRKIISMDDYPYAGIDLRGDLDMPLLLGASYGHIGNKFLNISFFLYFCI